MDDLIKALRIFAKYDKPEDPTYCEYEVMYVLVDPALVSDEDKVTLKELGFFVGKEHTDCFMSFRFGN